MEDHPRHREKDRLADRGGDPGREGLSDIFDVIARNIFTQRGLPINDAWVTVIAEEYRIAMQALRVEVKPVTPPPNPKRTLNAQIMLLFAGLENRDIWIRDTLLPLTQPETGPAYPTVGASVKFEIGDGPQYILEARYEVYLSRRELIFDALTAVTLPHGTRHTMPAWVRGYRPARAHQVYNEAVAGSLPDEWRVREYADGGSCYEWSCYEWSRTGGVVLVQGGS